ncbi:MAG: hypothetical protein Q7W55_10105 [Pseudohongiella sp.]|nr:hypothetical protein [Pseudohongiella sp.]MDO9519793.1 hypothetical protein [Pseudohongiella sp.]MDP2126241.1 hypothetical protein [Pseudohongiella sp.]
MPNNYSRGGKAAHASTKYHKLQQVVTEIRILDEIGKMLSLSHEAVSRPE